MEKFLSKSPLKIIYNIFLYFVAPPAMLAGFLFSGTARLFPTAQEFLKFKGYDSSLVSKVTDATNIRIRDPMTRAGALHAYFDFFNEASTFSPSGAEKTPRMIRGNPFFLMDDFNLGRIPDKGDTLRTVLTGEGFFSTAFIENDPLTAREVLLVQTLHEFEHTAKAVRSLSNQYAEECNSDIPSVDVAAESLQNPEIKTAILNLRALVIEDAYHDCSLILDARNSGQPIPSFQQTLEATQELIHAAALQMKDKDAKNQPWQAAKNRPWARRDYNQTDLFTGYLQEHIYRAIKADAKMSPLARRRSELALVSLQYFAPTAAKAIKEYVDSSSEPSHSQLTLTQ